LQARDDLAFLIPYFDTVYGGLNNHTVRMRDGSTAVIRQCDGVMQGDPLGPFWFCLALQDALAAAAAVDPTCLVRSFIDDPALAGKPKAVAAVAAVLVAEARRVGLEINIAKGKTYSQQRGPPAAEVTAALAGTCLQDVPVVGTATILGCTFGPDEAITAGAQRLADRLVTEINKLESLGDAQTECLIMRFCHVTGLNHLLRTTRPSLLQEACKTLDKAILGTVERWAGQPLTELARLQAQLPLSMSGLGLTPSAGNTSPYLAGVLAFRHLLGRIYPAEKAAFNTLFDGTLNPEPALYSELCQALIDVDKLRSDLGKPEDIVNMPTDPEHLDGCKATQHTLNVLRGERQRKEFFAKLQGFNLIRVVSASGPGACDWLRAIPSDAAFKIPDALFKMGVRHLLGLPLGTGVPEGTYIGLRRRVLATDLSMEKSTIGGGISARHNEIVQIMMDCLRAAGHWSYVEPTGLCDRDGRRPDGFTLIKSRKEPSVAFDVTVVHPLTAEGLRRAGSQHAAATEAEKHKEDKYKQHCLEIGVKFIPLAVESYGTLGPQFNAFLGEVASTIPVDRSPGTTWANKQAVQYFKQAISVARVRSTMLHIMTVAHAAINNGYVSHLDKLRQFKTLPSSMR
jgi:hypothetical protein